MGYLVFFVMGFLICLVLLHKPLKFDIHHTYENVISAKTEEELEQLQEKMLKDDPKNDKLYEEIDNLTTEINDIMGGSDRNG